ncbi:DsbA family protein [Proteus vulgaris]|uniref:Protein-disulfide isomerase n=1 Tax=Proteus vulgaris TaxID=585 RepID=A0A6G6SJG2_PROVU|nr:DsbA family protein [Proteus vulgaris]QIF93199.1 protein-disulfide isomerase [Proteus vulgaris]WIF73187.1 DsbA family protein [Proteus vulgaris]CRL65895.1 DSBA-like thioredoxin domain protein [Proteus vulgaris]SUC13722.1 DSBA-like thioredoxin domain [Proteus vulgaris]
MASVTSSTGDTQSTKILHYVYDPLCGWCYGIAPLIEVVSNIFPDAIKLHGGGLFTPTRAVTGGQSWKEHVTPIDERISQLSGQVFSHAYRDTLGNTEMVLNSLLPISAILVAQIMGKRDVYLLKALQEAYYLDGLNISDKNTLLFIVKKLGFDVEQFASLLSEINEAQTQQHLSQTQQLMSQVNGRGFPTLFIEDAQGYHLISVEKYLGNTKRWQQFITENL